MAAKRKTRKPKRVTRAKLNVTALTDAGGVAVELSLVTRTAGIVVTGDVLRGSTTVATIRLGRPWSQVLEPGRYVFSFGTAGEGKFSLGVKLAGGKREQVSSYEAPTAANYTFRVSA